MLSLSIWIPIYDRLILPLLRRITRNEEGISLLQRIGIGMVLAIVTMLVSALVENHRRTLDLTRPTLGLEPRKGAISSMSGYWLIPQLAIAGISESFTVIVVHQTTRVGESENWLSDDLNKGRLDYFYYLVAGLEVVNLVYFLFCSKYYKYKTRESNIKDVAMEEL
ncbi:NRT1 PTR FAMILY -like [Olea europaea subsp. europaea]|uniref:NRT1 PTR FAMILY -like n=1 Tax=Olea europaea subsp. europaea TaxID=158383 RepID=A0A8S0T8J7_OLEEU|nr:NRT1 PTR FAMILY -like [Olea europaea subsp. europaea]